MTFRQTSNRASLLILFLSVGIFGVFVVIFFWVRESEGVQQAMEHTNEDTISEYHPMTPFDRSFVITADEAPFHADTRELSGGVIPHHLLAHPLIAHFFQGLAKSDVRPETIILIGPNHFGRGTKDVLTSMRGWETVFGRVESDPAMAKSLIGNDFSGVDDVTIEGDHAIYGIIPFIRYYLPEVRVVPLLLSSRISPEETELLAEKLAMLVTEGSVSLIASTDFSHYLSSAESQEKDMETLQSILSRDYRQIGTYGNDHIDSSASLIAVMKAYEKSHWNHIQVFEHTDSGKMQQKPNMENTSYFTFGFLKKTIQKAESKSVSLLFGGDMMFDRSIRTAMRRHGNDFPLAPLRELFSKSDLVVANLEGPITDNVSKSEGSEIGARENYFFTFDPSVAKALKDASVGMVNLGNNHILNFGEDGVAQTKQYLEAAEVGYFGAPTDTGNRYWVHDVNGMSIAFVNYNQFIVNGEEKALADIAEAKMKSDFVVLYTHWGKEYVPALQSVKDLAHEFVSVGADLIIGSHPHVVQEHEVYHGKTIYYSLGNLIFDQYFSEETKNGLLVKAIIETKTKEVTIEEIPITLKSNGQTVPGGLSH